MIPRTDRRRFLKDTTLLGAGVWISGSSALAASRSPNEKLNIGIIGAGGRGASNLKGVQGENIVALCDVDSQRAAGAFKQFPGANRYHDYRKMLEMEKQLDAVVVSTPDHNHAPAAVMAMRLGRHVYCEKPLTHSVHEARIMRKTAAENNVVTQMGNQGHSMDGSRRTVELIQSGAIGDVSEVHTWSDRPIWPQGVDRPSEAMAVPGHMKWDLWLGPAPTRPYNKAYAPFNWRGWWDFGTGALGDMACHVIDVAFWSLKLEDPISIEAESSAVNDETAPNWSIIRYEFAARGKLPPCRMTWYDGGKKPPTDLVGGLELPANGSVLVGDQGTLLLNDPYGGDAKLLPEEKFADFKAPEPTLPRAPDGSHHLEWIEACKAQDPTMALSNFEYSTRLTETVLLGNLAVRAGKRIEWDAANMRVKNMPEMDQYLRREYRAGWTL